MAIRMMHLMIVLAVPGPVCSETTPAIIEEGKFVAFGERANKSLHEIPNNRLKIIDKKREMKRTKQTVKNEFVTNFLLEMFCTITAILELD